MSTADSLKKLLDEFTEKQELISEERTAVEGQIQELEGRLQDCNTRLEVVGKDREKVLSFKDRYAGLTYNGGMTTTFEKRTEKQDGDGSEAKPETEPPHIEAVKPERRTLFASSRMSKEESAGGAVSETAESAAEPTSKMAKSLFSKGRAAAEEPPKTTIEPPTVSVPDRSHAFAAAAEAAEAAPQPVEAASQQPEPASQQQPEQQPEPAPQQPEPMPQQPEPMPQQPEPIAPLPEVPAPMAEAPVEPAPAPMPEVFEQPIKPLEPVAEVPAAPEAAVQPAMQPTAEFRMPQATSEMPLPPPIPEAAQAAPESPAWLKPATSITGETQMPGQPSAPAPNLSAVERFSAQFARESVGGAAGGWPASALDAELPVPQIDEPVPMPPVQPAGSAAGGISSLLADLTSGGDAEATSAPAVQPEAAPAVGGDPQTAPTVQGGFNSLLRGRSTGEMPFPNPGMDAQSAIFGDPAPASAPPPAPAFGEQPPAFPGMGETAAGAVFGEQPGQPFGQAAGIPPQPVPQEFPGQSAPTSGAVPPQPKAPPAPRAPVAPPAPAAGTWSPQGDQEQPPAPAQPAGGQTVDLNSVEGQEEEGDGDTVKSINDALRSLFR